MDYSICLVTQKEHDLEMYDESAFLSPDNRVVMQMLFECKDCGKKFFQHLIPTQIKPLEEE